MASSRISNKPLEGLVTPGQQKAIQELLDRGVLHFDNPRLLGALEGTLSAEEARWLIVEGKGYRVAKSLRSNSTSNCRATSPQWGKINALFAELSITTQEDRAAVFGDINPVDLYASEASRLIDRLIVRNV